MNTEKRIIKASVLAGATDIAFGIIAYTIGFADWYYTRFHMFGVLGIGMLAYGYWHLFFYNKETGGKVWKK